ncbi:MAG TPA: hypothetical protein VFU02_10935 [Polyangiaceae bacterium]|nr:hypothetical protein [Polyangiaceae bacterium]
MPLESHRFVAVLVGLLLAEARASAETAATGDVYELRAHSETHAQLFRRALLPGPNGELVATETAAPLREYVSLGGYGFASPLGADSVDIEISAWGSVQLGEPLYLGRYDGDLQSANVLLRSSSNLEPRLRLGRQQVAGGAARFARFDGAYGSVAVVPELTLSAYGGWTVLPRWDREPGYYLLGSAADTELRHPEALQDVDRSGFWLAGGRVAYADGPVRVAASLHEQRESSELGRRNLGLDAGADVTDDLGVGGDLLFELDSSRIANLNVWSDLTAFRVVDLNVEYLRTEPALLLSRQSVLSVFSTDGYHETGGSLRWRLDERFSLGGAGWIDIYDGEHQPGARVHGNARYATKGRFPTIASITYSRVVAPDNGYHGLKAALSRRLLPPLTGTLQLFGFFYDEPIEGYRTSSIYSTTLEYAFLERLALLLGGSLARSPYASLDASALLRLTYEFDAPSRRPEW